MSTVKFQCPPYKLFEPDYHPQKPIIVGVDDRLESPDTIALRYEEAARVETGGDPRGDSPPKLLEMATYTKAQLPSMHAGYDVARYQDAGYEQYSTQAYPTQQQSDKFAHLNQQSFASNSAAVAQYMPSGPTVLSCQPATGIFGTKVYVKLSSQYDLFSLSTPIPTWFLVFGSEKCSAQDVSRDIQEGSGFIYTCSGDAPQFLVTNCANSNVPLSLVLDGPSGEEISRIPVGTFQYLEGSGDDITRSTKMPKHEDAAPATTIDQPSTSPKGEPQLPSEPGTNTYEYPPQQGQYANTFPQANMRSSHTFTCAETMSLRIAPRKVASSALPRTSRLEYPLLSHRTSKCAFSTSRPSNRRQQVPSPVDSVKLGEKPAKTTITLTTSEQSAENAKSMVERATKLAQEREDKLRQARSARLGKLSADADKRQDARENLASSERREKAKQAEERTNAAEEKKKTGLTKEERKKAEKEDYNRRHKQLERFWLKFMVGMPIVLVVGYELFQRLVMGKEQKVMPWKQAKINKEREERERLAMVSGGSVGTE